MPYKDPDKQKEYQREWQRLRKAGVNDKPTIRTLNPADVKTARGLLDLLSQTLADVQQADVDVLMKARCTGYLISIGLKCVETADIIQRIEELEEQAEEGGRRYYGH